MPARLAMTPVGPLLLVEAAGSLVEIRFAAGGGRDDDDTPLLRNVESQISDYFAGLRTGFEVPLADAPTPFQARIRQAMLAIPYGATRSYGDLARDAGGAPRAVGQACGANPLPIVVPCHRVVASGGIGGYSGGAGLETKRFLLNLETAVLAG